MTPFDRLQALARPGRIPAPPREMVGALQPGSQTAFDRLQAHAQPGRLPMQQPQMAAPPAMPPQAPQGQPQATQGPLSAFRDPVMQQGLLGLGMGLLEASGPSTTPTSFGQAMSRGMNAGVGMMQQERGNQMQERMYGLREQQIEADNAEAAAKADVLQAQRASIEELMRSPAIPDAVKALGPDAVMQFAKTHAGELAKPRGAPTTRTINVGGKEVTQEWSPETGWQQVAEAGRWKPEAAPGTAEYTAAMRLRDLKIQQAMELQGLSLADATALVDGQTRVVTDPVAGGSLHFNEATGAVYPIEIPREQIPLTGAGLERIDTDAMAEATGFPGVMSEGISKTLGQLSPDFVSVDTAQARTSLKTLRNALTRALAISERPPVIEQERIVSMLPSDGVFESPARARAVFGRLRGDLIHQRDDDAQFLNQGLAGADLEKKVRARIFDIDQILNRMVDEPAGSGDGGDDISDLLELYGN